MTPILIWNFITAVSGGYAAAHLAPQKFGKTVTALIWAAYTLALVRLSALLPAAGARNLTHISGHSCHQAGMVLPHQRGQGTVARVPASCRDRQFTVRVE